MDDIRDCPPGWVLARTTSECLELLEKNKGQVEILSLDHDMSDKDMDGYYVTHAMVDKGLYANEVYFHTANPRGRENMFYLLSNAIKHQILPPMILHNTVVHFIQEEEYGQFK